MIKSITLLIFLFCSLTLSSQSQTELKKTLSPDGAANKFFGGDVSLYDGIALVGENDAAYIFYQDQGGIDNWGDVKKLQPADILAGERFGRQVALEGDIAVVSAQWHNNFRGAVYIFSRNVGGANNWGQIKKIVPANPSNFGTSVALQNNSLVVGAGSSVFLFEKDEGGLDNWGQVTELVASDSQFGDRFGDAVDIYEDIIIVGANGVDDVANEAGAVYIYQKNQINNSWVETKKITDPGGSDFAQLGRNHGISVYDDLIAIGAYQDNSAGNLSGVIRVHQKDHGGLNNWGLIKELLTESGDRLGYSVDMQRDFIIGGAIDGVFTSNPPGYIGGAYVFNRNEGGLNNWGLVTELVASDPENFSTFHASEVSLYNDRIIGAAFRDDDNGSNSGSVYFYSLSGNVPICIENYSGVNKLVGTITSNATYETNGAIESEQIINAVVDYDSATEINLLEGFEVVQGSLYHAFIDGCD